MPRLKRSPGAHRASRGRCEQAGFGSWRRCVCGLLHHLCGAPDTRFSSEVCGQPSLARNFPSIPASGRILHVFVNAPPPAAGQTDPGNPAEGERRARRGPRVAAGEGQRGTLRVREGRPGTGGTAGTARDRGPRGVERWREEARSCPADRQGRATRACGRSCRSRAGDASWAYSLTVK